MRFGAIMQLVFSSDPDVDALLSQTIDEGLFRGSEAGAAAAEFVRLKRSGQEPNADPSVTPLGVGILLISIDTLRADHLSCYGYERDTSPTLDALAESGALFENAFSPTSWTLPAHMSIFTSLYPSFHKLDKAGKIGNIRLDDSVPSLPEVLKAAGYTTAGFVAHGYMSGEWGFDRGFDFYRPYVTHADQQTDRILLWLEWHRFRVSRGLVPWKFFLFAHYLDPHGRAGHRKFLEQDLAPGDPRRNVALYDSEIHFVDQNLRRIFDMLRNWGWQDATLTIVTSDHGEELYDHGTFGHKSTLYDELLRVPLIIAYPRGIAPDQYIETPSSLLDIFPTILAFVGMRTSGLMQGASLTSSMKLKGLSGPNTIRARRDIYAELHPVDFGAGWDFFSRSIQGERYKLISSYYKDGRREHELYELARDPVEKVNLYAARKNEREVRELEAKLLDFILEGARYRPELAAANRIEIDEETQERLRALGYID